MAAASKTMTFPQFPIYDDAATRALFTQNVEVAAKAQRMMLDAAEAMVKRHFALTREAIETSQAALLNYDFNKKPEAYVEEAKAAAERAQALVKQEIDNSMKVQQDVVNLVGKQVRANVGELNKFAA